jgi:tyrosyl-tRNA synthetase
MMRFSPFIVIWNIPMPTHIKPILDELRQRGLIAQMTDEAILHEQFLTPQTIYCGFDPTADSLHIGHLVPLLILRRLQKAGHHVIALIGGATGMIGDPSFKATERVLNSAETVQDWVQSLSCQITALLPASEQTGRVTIANNADWISQMDVLSFLRDIGKNFSVNAMIAKDSVQQRLARPDQGISFTEFAYSLLQSYDFSQLNQRYGCTLQIGGNDQWGNITSGIDLTRRLNNARVFGITVPLITKADGTKFGKTETGTVWLDPKKTSPYAFYQFWLNTTDADVYRFLRYYTFLSLEDILQVEARDQSGTGKPQAQRVLAHEMTCLVHGAEAYHAAERISSALFNNDFSRLSLAECQQLELDGLPMTELHQRESLTALLVQSGLASSNRQAREFIQNSAVSVNGDVWTQEDMSALFPLHDRYWIIRRGKKQFHLFKLH